jgi:hypothetical protein
MKTILFIFAGREENLSIQKHFIKKALELKIIDECHIWNFARKPSDRDWINKNFKNKKNIKIKYGSIRNTGNSEANFLYKECFTHYSDKNYENSLFIKVDDDIIFWDIDYLKGFVDFAKNINIFDIVSANVINHVNYSEYQYKEGYFNDIGFEFNHPKPLLENRKTEKNWQEEELFNSGKKATEIHKYFCKNYKNILQKARLSKKNVDEIIVEHLFSINFIAFKYDLMKEILKPYNDGYTYDEEIITKILPKKYLLNSKLMVYKRFIVSHLSYTPQRTNFNTKEIIKLYKETFKIKNEVV